MDHFKKVNDARGHLCGDQVLCEVARRMIAALRPYDVLGRFGGEEFLVALTADAPEAAAVVAAVAERLRAAVSAGPLSIGGLELSITISVGVATSAPGSAVNPESLLHAADGALYRAKHEGRNRVCVALSNPDPRPVATGARASVISPCSPTG